MDILSPSLQKLIQKLTILPGVGPKSAQRMAIYLLQKKKLASLELAEQLQYCLENIHACAQCRNFAEAELCQLCQDPKRDSSIWCIVESIADLISIEQTGVFQGRYFVLMGHLSPIERIGPEELGIPLLLQHCQNHPIKEIILATNATIEGQVTANYLTEQIPKSIKITRLASGVPIGAELEYLNDNTLFQAISQRTEIDNCSQSN